MLNKIRNNTFLKSTLILLFGGILGKAVGFIIRIIVTRSMSAYAIGLYSLLGPTTSLLTVLSISSYSNAISKYISDKSSNINDILSSIVPVSLILNIIFIIITILFGKHLSYVLVKDNSLYFPIICISLTMPFMSMSAIIKGYFWGIENMSPYMISNFIEQIVRLILILLFLNKISEYGEIYSICFIISINIIGEISSQIVMLKYMPKIKINKISTREIIKIYKYSIPSTLSKIVGTISYFLEPIIITNMLLQMKYSKEYITLEYGVLNAYSLSLLLIPHLFIQNMSTSLIPELSKNYEINNIKLCKKRINQMIIYSSLIGSISTTIITLFPSFFLNLLYNTTKGIDYIKLLSPFMILFYIESILINSLNALGKTKEIFYISLKVSVVRLLSIIIFSLLGYGMYSLVLSIIINISFSTYLYYKEINKSLHIS